MTKHEALTLALEILKAAYVPADLDEQREKAITELEALAQPEQESADSGITVDLLERLKATLTKLGYATPEGGLEAFGARLPTQLYNLCRGVDELIKTALAQPEQEQLMSDQINYGMSVTQGGKRIDPMSIYKEPEQEPVAWMCTPFGDTEYEFSAHQECENCVPCYTTPPKREWVGLTDEHIGIILNEPNTAEVHQGAWLVLPYAYAYAIEAKLKEKNT